MNVEKYQCINVGTQWNNECTKYFIEDLTKIMIIST